MQRKLKIKLISPKMGLRPMDSEFKRRMSPSLALVTLASLTPEPHEVSIEDENIRPVNFADHPDLVGITVNVESTFRAIDISNKYRKKGVKVIFGGIQASANPDELKPYCDSVCIGEAEDLWLRIIQDVSDGNLQDTYFNSEVTDLKKVPVPKWEYISKKDYLYYNIIHTSRGCPFRCEFCYNSCDYIRNKFRNRPVENVLTEIKNLKLNQVMFIDDNFIGNIEWTDHFIDQITPLNLIWHAAVSTNLVHHPDLIGKMARSGCRSLFIGFESIHSESVKSVNKVQNKTGEYEKLIRMLHENGIMVNASLVFGFDHDTPATFEATLNWLIKNKIESMTGHILTPFPGTRLYKRLKAENRIIDKDLRKYNTSDVVFQPKNISADELRKGYLSMYKDFYSFRNIFRRLPENKKRIAPFLMFNFGYRKFGRLTSMLGKIGLMNKIGQWGRKLSYGIE